jgi:hypothetical protein
VRGDFGIVDVEVETKRNSGITLRQQIQIYESALQECKNSPTRSENFHEPDGFQSGEDGDSPAQLRIHQTFPQQITESHASVHLVAI